MTQIDKGQMPRPNQKKPEPSPPPPAPGYDSQSIKQRQGHHTITLRHPRGIFHVEARNCWHEGDWLLFRQRVYSDGGIDGTEQGSKIVVQKVPIHREVNIAWEEKPERTEDD